MIKQEKLSVTDQIQEILNIEEGITKEQKNFLFAYLARTAEENEEKVDTYGKNVVIIVNSFFEYGFIPQNYKGHDYEHYWQLLVEHFT